MSASCRTITPFEASLSCEVTSEPWMDSNRVLKDLTRQCNIESFFIAKFGGSPSWIRTGRRARDEMLWSVPSELLNVGQKRPWCAVLWVCQSPSKNHPPKQLASTSWPRSGNDSETCGALATIVGTALPQTGSRGRPG